MRTGMIAEKLGMSRFFTEDGFHIPVTLLRIEECQIIAHRTVGNNGYTAIQVGFGNQQVRKLSKSLKGYFEKLGVAPKKCLAEFRVSEKNLLPIGTILGGDHFATGSYVDVTGITRGKGFAGGMKRHNFGGLRASHGVSISHRSHGSTGQRQDPGRVFKGKKMAGHMGDVRATIQNLLVIDFRADLNTYLIKGAIPGGDHSFVFIKDAIKKPISFARQN